MAESLHIVCLDAPSPPDYGGAIDMYYKIRALAASGRKIILHYFNYKKNRGVSGLQEYCAEVYAYPRKSFAQTFPFNKPFIVASRINQSLIKRLNSDEHPVLIEGLHCSGIVPHLNEPARVVIRMHNEEATYYGNLARSEKNLVKRLYFGMESSLLEKFQRTLNKDLRLACLSRSDVEVFINRHGFRNVTFLPTFIPWNSILSKEGKGNYCLYHGNMTVAENEQAASWLIEEIFSKTSTAFIIAGKQISQSVEAKAAKFKNISLVSNPSDNQMNDLVANAHINVLPSMNSTGVKLKLLNALFNGRHCITNARGIEGSGITSGVFTAERAGEWINLIEQLEERDFTQSDADARAGLLAIYDNRLNAQRLNALL